MLFILFWAGFIGSARVAFFLNDAGGIIEWACGYEALLARGSLDIEDEAISWKLLATFDPEDVAWLDISPGDWHKPLNFSGDHQVFDLFVVYFICNLSLSEF